MSSARSPSRAWASTTNAYVHVDERFLRPVDITETRGNAAKRAEGARLGADGLVRGLVAMMVDSEVKRIELDAECRVVADVE